ncbi:MAG: FecR domain-containing protein [Tannerella sp.]|nr:FecR domain-containing protein [Tannerella sp.]
MNIPDRQVIERTLSNTATPEEARAALRWFATPEGRACLSVMMDEDVDRMLADPQAQQVDHPVPTNRMYAHIRRQIHRRRLRRTLLRVAAVLIPVALLAGQFIYFGSRVDLFGRAAYEEIRVPRGERMQVVFQDGSRAILNADSRIRYPRKFAFAERRVELEGEAWFEIAPAGNRPFRIGTGALDVDVRGTAFNVRAYPDDAEIFVTLETGKVSLTAAARTLASLAPGEQAVFNKKTGVCSIFKPEDITGRPAWTDRRLVFDAAPLADVMATLARCYDVDFAVADSASLRYACTLTTSAKKPLAYVLAELEKITPVRFREAGERRMEVFLNQ